MFNAPRLRAFAPPRSSLRLLLRGMLFSGLAAATVACGGSAKARAKASADASADAEVDFDAEGSGAWDMSGSSDAVSKPEGESHGAGPALLGARHDLLLAEDAPTPCKCLAVLLGGPETPKMVWTGRQPVIDSRTQLVIALGSDGVECAEDGPGASYRGYEQKEGNVVVYVEGVVDGRPVTHGAIIPRPASGGKVIIEPGASVPYGRGNDGAATCSLALDQ